MQFTHTHFYTDTNTHTFTMTHTHNCARRTILTAQLLVVCADSDILLAAKTNYMKIYCK